MFTNWKTTLMGALTAAIYAALTMAQTGSIQPRDIAIASGVAALGAISKDFNVTGK